VKGGVEKGRGLLGGVLEGGKYGGFYSRGVFVFCWGVTGNCKNGSEAKVFCCFLRGGVYKIGSLLYGGCYDM
jgi:hypothetical protein